MKKHCISLFRFGNQHIVRLQIKYRYFQRLEKIWTKIWNLDKILGESGYYGQMKDNTLDRIFVQSIHVSDNREQDIIIIIYFATE